MSSLHRKTLVSLAQQHGWTRGVELGVDRGILFRMLLEGCPDLHLTGVDLFPDMDRSRRAWDFARTQPNRADLLIKNTESAADMFDDYSLDFVFIDADHSEPAVAIDIARWAPKVRRGGWVGGHDYSPKKFPGVVRAVDRAFGQAVQTWPGTIWGVWR